MVTRTSPKAINSEPMLARRDALLQAAALAATVLGATSSNLLTALFAAEPPRKLVEIVDYYAGHVSGVRGPCKNPMDDIGYRILSSMTLEQWKSRTMTAPPNLNAVFYGNNTYLLDVAHMDYAVEGANNPHYRHSALEEFDPSYLLLRKSGRKITQAEVEDFGKKVESGRLASMFFAATVADLAVTSKIIKPKLGKLGYLSLPQALLLINDFLKGIDYTRLSKAEKESVEDIFIKELYGNENGELLIKAFTNIDKGKDTERYNNGAWREFIRPIAIKQGLFPEEE